MLKIITRTYFYDIQPSAWKKISERNGNGSNSNRRIEGNTQISCNINKMGLVAAVYGINLSAYRQKS
jgi:hypothetical protein